MSEEIKILCVDDEQNVLNSLVRLFIDCDYNILTATSGKEGLDILEKENVHVIISDYRMPVMDGAEFLKKVCKRWPQSVRLVLSGYADTGSILSSINEGHIYKFIPKPWNDEELKGTISNAIERYFLVKKNEELNAQLKEKNEQLIRLNDQLKNLLREKSNSLEFTDKILTLYQRFFNSIPFAVCGIDFADNVTLYNSYWNDIMGKNWYTSGDSIESVLPENIKGFIEKVKASRKAEEQFEINHISGKLMGSVVELLDKNTGFILVFISGDVKGN